MSSRDYMEGSAAPDTFRALERPDTGINRLLVRIAPWIRPRECTLASLTPAVDDALARFEALGAPPSAISAVRESFETRWSIAEVPAPKDVWCGEVVFNEDELPLVLMYPDSPWGRLPSAVWDIGTQTGVDHMVAHLLSYFAGEDHGEEAACRDQVRLMLARRRLSATATAALIAIGHRFHKNIPLSNYGWAIREGLASRIAPPQHAR